MAARLTKTQRQKLKQLIIIADIHKYTEAETLQFIRESLGYDISRDTLYQIKRENKQDAINWLSKMMGNKKYSYIAEFKRHIEEFEMYKAMWFKLYDSTKSEFIKLKCIEKMAHMTIALVNMYNLLPQIAQKVPIDVINNKKGHYNDMDPEAAFNQLLSDKEQTSYPDVLDALRLNLLVTLCVIVLVEADYDIKEKRKLGK